MRSNREPNARKSASASPTANASGATTRTTTSSPVSAAVEVLNASLINRLALFLSTARRSTLLPTTSPKRGLAAAPRWAMTASGGAERRMFGRLNTASKSRRWRKRSSRPKRRDSPAAATHRLRRGPSGGSSGIGIRRTPANSERKGEDAPNGPGGQPLHRQAFASFRPPGVQHFPAVLGGHARPEAVTAFALDHAWLVGSLHLRLALFWGRQRLRRGLGRPHPVPRPKGVDCGAEGSGCQRDRGVDPESSSLSYGQCPTVE